MVSPFGDIFLNLSAKQIQQLLFLHYSFFFKVYDAIERQKRYFDNKYYFAADTDVIKKHISQLQLPETLMADYKPEDSHSVVDLKSEIESNSQREISFTAHPKK